LYEPPAIDSNYKHQETPNNDVIISNILIDINNNYNVPSKIGIAEYMSPILVDFIYNGIIHSYSKWRLICKLLFTNPDIHELYKYYPKLFKLYMARSVDNYPILPETSFAPMIITILDILIDMVEIINNRIIEIYKQEGKVFDRSTHKLSAGERLDNFIVNNFTTLLSFDKKLPNETLEIIKAKFLQFMSSLIPKQYWVVIFSLIVKEKYDIIRFLHDTIFTNTDVEYLLSTLTDKSNYRHTNTNKIIKCLMIMGYSLDEMDLSLDKKRNITVEQLEDEILDFIDNEGEGEGEVEEE
jgi:hypothetical protein